MEDDKGAVQLGLLRAENRRLKDEAESAKSQAEALQMLNQQIIDRYTTDLSMAIRERQQAREQVASLESWNKNLSETIDQLSASTRREKKNLKQQLVAKDERIKKLHDDIENMSRHKVAGLEREIHNLNFQLEIKTEDFEKRTTALKEAHEREMAELERCLRSEIEKLGANETKAQYEKELARMWREMADFRAQAESLRQTVQHGLKQAEEEAVRARETPVSAAVVAAGSSWKAQLQVGSVLFDLGTWHTDEGRERAEKVLSKLMYKLTGKCSEDSPLLTEEKRKLAHTSIVEVFCQLKRRERLSRSSPLAEHM